MNRSSSAGRLLLSLMVGIILLQPFPSQAITPPPFKDESFAGKYVTQSLPDPLTLEAGSVQTVRVRFKNTGQSTWQPTGRNYVSAYTVDLHYRISPFAHSSWLARNQPAKITTVVKPGETGEIILTLQAPLKTGTYTERFYLAAENKTWIKGSYFYIKINVIPVISVQAASHNAANSEQDGVVDDEASVVTKEYKAHLLAFSARNIAATGGEQVHFIVRYINDGTQPWQHYVWQEAASYAKEGIPMSALKRITVADQSWLSATLVASGNQTVESGKPLEIAFDFRAPRFKGEYIARFQLTANNHTLDGGTLEVPISVTADAPADYQEPAFTSTRPLIAEPNIRVGLYKIQEPAQFKSSFTYTVFSGEVLHGALAPDLVATINYFDGVYSFKSAEMNFNAREPIRLVPDDPSSYFELVNYNRRVSWKGDKNFNAYRGTMEVKYSSKHNVAYVVNELPLDLYVAGIAETSNGAAMEYIKALLLAARTYAYYHIHNGVPADQRTYDVVATTADQLYLGYNSEVLMPRVVQAAQATYGYMVTYNGKPVVTPYFGHSDGRTRTWSQVWGGSDKPWLQSVEAVYDKGLKMFGHGVGMSARDAAHRADKDGWTYEQLLKHYYTGVEIEKIY